MEHKKEFNRGPVLFIAGYHLVLLLTLPFYLYFAFPALNIWISALILLYLTGLSITGGYHRYYAHRTYKTSPFIESIVLFFATMAVQGSALRWAFDHRLHHAHVDTDNDPYSIKKGFWYAHCLWIMERPRPIDQKIVSDLMRNRLVMFQHRWYRILMVASNAIACLFVGWLCNDYWGAFFIATFLRMLFLHHFTWFINSLAHTWGDKPFCQEQTAVDNYIIALLTFGEGYHNFHHTFANDYRNGIRWFHFDPTKWVIWTLHKLGLAHSLKQVDGASIQKRIVIERKNLLLEKIQEHWSTKKDELSVQINELSEKLVYHLSEFRRLKEEYNHYKKQCTDWNILTDLKKEIKMHKQSLRLEWRKWTKLSRNILNLKPV